MPSTSREHRPKTGIGENAGDFGTLIPLDFDAPVLHRATAAARFLHLFGELFFFRQADADKIFHDGHGLSAAMRGLANDVNAAAIFWARGA